MNETPRITCTVCRKQKASLKKKNSKLISGMPLFLCSDCLEKKYEPRWAVILVARDKQRGLSEVRTYIRNHQYFGDKITAEELI